MRRLWLTAALLLFVTACGRHAGPPAAAAGPNGTGPLIGAKVADLPELPVPGQFLPQRVASQAIVQQTGSQAWKNVRAFPQAPVMTLNSTPNEVAYALYRFDGIPGESVAQVTYAGANLGIGTVWAAIGNYSTDRWSFFPPQQTAVATLEVSTTPGAYVSPGGDLYILLLVFGGDSFTVNSVTVTYPNRYVVSGRVQDDNGVPVPDATISTPALNLSATTDAGGNYTLVGVPQGNWPIMATKSSWTFYSNPGFAQIDAADASLDFVGHQNSSNFIPHDPGQTDNGLRVPTPIDFSGGTHSDSLSIVDDPADDFRFSVNAPGVYYIELKSLDTGMYFPYLELRDSMGYLVDNSAFAYRGDVRLQFEVVDPATFDLRAGLSGGGGQYSLALKQGQCRTLIVLTGYETVVDGDLVPILFSRSRTLVEVASGGFTEYLTDGNGRIMDLFRPSEMHTVTPTLPGHVFTPLTDSVDLSTDDGILWFEPAATPLSDSREPNDDFAAADAGALLSLPYDSELVNEPFLLQGLPASEGDPTDTEDFYRFRPAAGAGLEIEIELPAAEDGSMVYPILYNEDQEILLTTPDFFPTTTGLKAYTSAPVDNGVHYLRIGTYDDPREVAYRIKIVPFTPAPVGFTVQLDSKPIPGAIIELRDAGFTWRKVLLTDDTGGTPLLMLREGQQVYAEVRRYGFNIDRWTRLLTVPAGGTTEVFNVLAADSADKHEPDNATSTACNVVPMPFTTTATLDPESDPVDYYRLFVQSDKTIQVTVDSGRPGDQLLVRLFDSLGGISDSGTAVSGVPMLLQTGSLGSPYYLELQSPDHPTAYEMQISLPTQLFPLRGFATLDGQNGVEFCRVYCPELDRYSETELWGGRFDLGRVPPGTYTLQMFAPGYQPEEHVVTVTNSQVVDNFTLVPAYFDLAEPDDSPAQANSVALDGTPSAVHTMGLNGDINDFFAIPASKGQLCQVTVDWGPAWHSGAIYWILDKDQQLVRSSGGGEDGSATVTFLAKQDGPYYARIFVYPAEYTISVKVIDQP